MRNFDERKAEIFRRSEERIRARKRKRNSILALCFTLCLTIAVVSVKYLPKVISFNSKAEETENFYIEYEYATVTNYSSLEISNNITPSENITDKSRLENIYNTIQSAFSVDGNSVIENETNGTNGANQNVADENYSEPQIYTLTFSSNDGSKSVYILSGKYLTNKTSNQVVKLSNKHLAELKKLLGL